MKNHISITYHCQCEFSVMNFKIKCESLKPQLIVNKIIDLYEYSADKI